MFTCLRYRGDTAYLYVYYTRDEGRERVEGLGVLDYLSTYGFLHSVRVLLSAGHAWEGMR